MPQSFKKRSKKGP